MSQIILNNYIDMVNVAATPSSIGYTIGYDLDGVLKQKDQNGIITKVGNVSTQRLDQTLNYGNNSGTYSIIMGTATYISSVNGSGRISLDYGYTSSVYISVTSSNTNSYINTNINNILLSNINGNNSNILTINSNTFSSQVGSTTYSVSLIQNGTSFSISHNDSLIGVGGNIKVFDTGKTYDGIGSDNKAYVHINTKNATTNNGVQNSVIIGGYSLTASKSNTVYLGNNVNVNNAYTLPNVDGLPNQVLMTNGLGTASWSTYSVNLPLMDVLKYGNDSATYSIIVGSGSSIILGTQSNLKSYNSTNQINFDYLYNTEKSILLSTDNALNTSSYLLVASSSIKAFTNNLSIVTATSSITTSNGLGLQYSSDYSSTFVANSLVSKAYVDMNKGSFSNYKISYVDINRGNNTTALVDRIDKPYATIASAIFGLTSSYSDGVIYIKKGIYTESAPLVNNVDYYCEQGVIFSQNGFIDSYGSVSSNVYGFASFLGSNSSLSPLVVNNSSNINFNFDQINNSQVAIKIIGNGSNVNIKGNIINTLSAVGYGISIEGSSNVNLKIRDGILGAYDTILVKSGYSGILNIDTPYIRVNGTLGNLGVQSGIVHALKVQNFVTGTINIKSNIENNSVTFGGGDNSALNISSGIINIDGNIKGNIGYGVYLPIGNASKIKINGDIYSQIEALVLLNDNTQINIKNSTIKSDGLGINPQVIYINSLGSVYINNSIIYNTLTDTSIINIYNVGSTLGIYNSLGYSPGTLGNFITSTSNFTSGIHNTRSNKDNNTTISDIFDPSGFIYDTNLFLPNF